MTFVGKILVAVQVILSLCFMAFAGAVYTVQEDWKSAYEGKEAALKKKDEELKLKQDQIVQLTGDLNATKVIVTETDEDSAAGLRQYLNETKPLAESDPKTFQGLVGHVADPGVKEQLKALAELAIFYKTKADEYKAERDEKVLLHAEQDKMITQHKNNLEKFANEAKERAREADTLKTANVQLTAKLSETQDKLSTKEQELFNLETDSRGMEDKQKNLLVKVAFLKDVILREGIDEKEAIQKDLPPPVISGKVLNIKPADRTGPDLVQISLGSDDGLAVGHQLRIYRLTGNGAYLGKMELTYVEGDSSVGKVILKPKNGTIQRGDNVTTQR